MLQSILNNSPSPTRNIVCLITAITGLDHKPPVSTFIRSRTETIVTVSEVMRDRTANVTNLKKYVAELYPFIQETVRNNREKSRVSMSKGEQPRFTEGDFVLVAREAFKAGEKLVLRWRGPRRIKTATSDYVYQVEDIRNGQLEHVPISHLRFFHDSALKIQAIMSHVLSSETGMPVSRLLALVDDPDGLHVGVHRKGLPHSKHTLEPLARVYGEVPQLKHRLLARKNTPTDMADKARGLHGL